METNIESKVQNLEHTVIIINKIVLDLVSSMKNLEQKLKEIRELQDKTVEELVKIQNIVTK